MVWWSKQQQQQRDQACEGSSCGWLHLWHWCFLKVTDLSKLFNLIHFFEQSDWLCGIILPLSTLCCYFLISFLLSWNQEIFRNHSYFKSYRPSCHDQWKITIFVGNFADWTSCFIRTDVVMMRPKKKSCLVVLHRPPLIFKNWKKVFTVQKCTAPNFQNSKKSFFFFENFDLLKIFF